MATREYNNLVTEKRKQRPPALTFALDFEV